MSSITFSQNNSSSMQLNRSATKAPIGIWFAYIVMVTGLFFLEETHLLSYALAIYLTIRVVSAHLYERYSSEYQDYEKEHSELFRDINNILGVDRGNVQLLNSDVNESNREQEEQELKLLKELQRKNKNEMTRREQWQLAILSERYHATSEPLRLFLIYKADYPNDLDADYLIAKVLLDKNNKSGLTFLKRAFKKFNLILPICELLNEYYFRQSDEEKSNYWLEKKNTFLAVADEAKQERTSLMGRGEFVEASLSDKQLEDIGKQLSDVKGLKAAWICEKIVTHYPEYPAYVLLVKRKHLFVNEQEMLTVLNSEMDFPDTTLVVIKNSRNRLAAKRIRKVAQRIKFS